MDKVKEVMRKVEEVEEMNEMREEVKEERIASSLILPASLLPEFLAAPHSSY